MFLKVFVVSCLALTFLEYTIGAPHNSKKEQSLEKSFVEFLQQDKQLSHLLNEMNAGGHPSLIRNVREAENELSDEQDVDVEPAKEPGFFDRAAKFVMEVLQRFLKWINTEN